MNDVPQVPVAGATEYTQVTQGNLPMPLALAIFFDDRTFERAKYIANAMSKAQGVTPQHLIGKPEACFAVVERAVTWRLSPFAVAMATYQTPGGRVGFEGKLVQAIIENSGYLEPGSGGVKYEFYGDWSKIQGRFTMREGKREDEHGNKSKYAAPTWGDDDAVKAGCGVTVSARLRGEAEPRKLTFDLVQAQPRNSTLWATDPKTQLCYAAVRRFASVSVPGLLMGVPWEGEDQPREINLGDADVVRGDDFPDDEGGAAEVKMPRPKQPLAPGGAVDKETGEVTRDADTAPATTAPAPAPAQAQAPNLITPAALRVLNAQLADRQLTDEFCKHFGLADPSELSMAKVNEAMQWVGQRGKAAQP